MVIQILTKDPTLVVFDFDLSLVDEDSYTFVIKQLDMSSLDAVEEKAHQSGWIVAMNFAMELLFQKGIKEHEIAQVLNRIPIQSKMIDAVWLAHDHGCDIKIVSDANTLFIPPILKFSGIESCFTEIVTNPACVDDRGVFQMLPYQSPPPNCPWCPDNLCKGIVLSRILSEKAYGQVLYVGDGPGDFCPATQLRSSDMLLARRAPEGSKEFECLQRVAAHGHMLTAEVRPWDSAADVLDAFTERLCGSGEVAEKEGSGLGRYVDIEWSGGETDAGSLAADSNSSLSSKRRRSRVAVDEEECTDDSELPPFSLLVR